VTNRFVWANVVHRPMRTLVSVLAISLEVVMILMVIGVTRGMVVDSAGRQRGLNADIYVQPSSAPQMFATASVFMDLADQDKIATIPGIQAIAPVLMDLNTRQGLGLTYGTDLDRFNAVTGGFTYYQGGPFSSAQAREMIVDDLFAESNRVKLNDMYVLKGASFKICGIVRHGKGARCYVPLRTLQDLNVKEGKVSMLLVKCQLPSQVNQVVAEIKQKLPGYSAVSAREWFTLVMNNRIPALDIFINVVVTISVIIGSFAIFLSMYTTISERTRDIGILKSMGASRLYIVSVILRESIALCLMGLASGVLITLVGRAILHAQFPTQIVVFSIPWVFYSALLVIVSGILGSLYPAMRAAKKDPIEALSYLG
jgi:putative ABC transport system permease protein